MLHVPRKALAAYVGSTILSLLILALVMQLWRADMTIPFSYGGGDEILHGTLTKGVMDNRWYLHNRFVGMPTGLILTRFPRGGQFPSFMDEAHLIFIIKLCYYL